MKAIFHKKFLFLISFFFHGIAFGEACCISDQTCDPCVPLTRADNIPQSHVAFSSDEYLSGYVQSLIDTHYYEFKVRVIVKDHTAYVFNIPRNQLVAYSIVCFIRDVPFIECVQPICCSPEEFICQMETANAGSCDYCSMEAVCEIPLPCCQISGIWFPQSNRLFAPLIADPRQVINSASLRFNDRVVGKHVGAASFGDEFPFFRWKGVLWWHGDLQIGLEAGVFSVFDLDHVDACMVNTDYFVGPSLTYAIDKWSYRLRLWHLSSHLGDEFLLVNTDCDRKNRSEEAIDFFASYQMNPQIRIYAGIGYVFDSDKQFREHPLYFQYGTEIRVFGCRNCFNKLYVQPFLAMNFKNWEEQHFNLDATYMLGVEYSSIQGIGRKFRIYGEYHDGYSLEGQFVKCRSHYAAIGVSYGF